MSESAPAAAAAAALVTLPPPKDAVVEPEESTLISDAERAAQKSYWDRHTGDGSIQAMMLDSKADDLDKEERPEILSLLPPFDGGKVVELGAGMVRNLTRTQ